ncbi:hypothetical protein [Stenotrophomonas sp.]|uniref:hypothetical protein n=1 Tax=Stenotrophomonas sp. TaxID=69392 RepID=UPI0028AB5F6D|nr:hypothetical protein [Stenotrophomonas sp.]
MTASRRRFSHSLLLLALTAGSAQAQPATHAQDAAGNRLEPLTEQAAPPGAAAADADSSAWYCTTDRNWCVRTVRDEAGAQLELAQQVAGERDVRLRYVPLPSEDEADSEQPWPFIVRLGPGIGAPQAPTDAGQAALQNVLVGALRQWRTSYSGGGASTSELMLVRLYHENDGIQIDTVATLPMAGSAMIRACFSEADVTARADACHDEYRFAAQLGLDPAGQGIPVLQFHTRATRFPAGVSRFGDSLEKGPLTAKDLRTETDRTCTYQRRLRWQAGHYRPDTPLPDCSEFTGL